MNLQTERLTIRPFIMEDFDETLRFINGLMYVVICCMNHGRKKMPKHPS